MPNIIDILARALSLRQETELNSITPNRAGGIMYDTLLVLNQMQLEGGALLISKVYASVAAMEADTTPTSDLTGRALKPGQLVVIVTTDTSSSDMGSEYRYNGPGSWTYVGKVGGLPFDTVPIQNSTKGITSGGVYTALMALKNEGYKYMGLATPGSGGTAPGTPNQPVFYVAGPGAYPNFGSITVASGYLGFIKYSGGSWSVESVEVGKDYDQEISQLREDVSVNGIQKSEYAYSHFTARETSSASVTLGTDILLTAPGDYIEIKTKAKMNGHILRRPTSSNQPTIRYSAQNTMQVRFNSSTNWTKQDNALDWNEVQILKVYLDSISGTTYNFKMYVNDTLLGTQDVTDPKGLNQVAYGNTTIDMDIYYIETKIGGVVNRWDKFAEMDGAEYVTDVYTMVDVPSLSELDERVSDLDADMSIVKKAVVGEDMYFRFVKQSSLSNIQSHFEVFQRIKDNIYARQTIGYYIYSGSAGYPNGYWRLERTNICTLVDGEQTTIQSQVLTAGENEFVLQWLAGSGYNFSGGFSGGYHYGETIDNVVGAWVEFVADGNRLSTEKDIPLTPCKSFYYREYSPIYQHNDDTIAAWHLKETEFKDGGYETINDVKFVQALDYFAYPGIVCVGRWLSEYAMPEGVATITDMGDGSTTIAEQFKSNGHRIHYEGNGYMCDVESEVLIGADDAQCQRVVYNSSAYNKYYRRNPDTAGSTSNRLKGRTKVKISAM